MKEYTSANPAFSESINIVETTDPAHADNINAATTQLLQNTLFIMNLIDNIGAVTLTDITISSGDWKKEQDSQGGYSYYAEVQVPGVTRSHFPVVSLYMDAVCKAAEAGLCPTVQSSDGIICFWARQPIESDIHATIALLMIGSPGSGSGTGGNYTLPTATPSRLGGVKIGDNVSVEIDGTISIQPDELLDDVIASDEDIDGTLDNIFGTKV